MIYFAITIHNEVLHHDVSTSIPPLQFINQTEPYVNWYSRTGVGK